MDKDKIEKMTAEEKAELMKQITAGTAEFREIREKAEADAMEALGKRVWVSHAMLAKLKEYAEGAEMGYRRNERVRTMLEGAEMFVKCQNPSLSEFIKEMEGVLLWGALAEQYLKKIHEGIVAAPPLKSLIEGWKTGKLKKK